MPSGDLKRTITNQIQNLPTLETGHRGVKADVIWVLTRLRSGSRASHTSWTLDRKSDAMYYKTWLHTSNGSCRQYGAEPTTVVMHSDVTQGSLTLIVEGKAEGHVAGGGGGECSCSAIP